MRDRLRLARAAGEGRRRAAVVDSPFDPGVGSSEQSGEPTGRFNTTFTFTAKLDPTIGEIHGRCHHPIVSGSGAFAGARGVISFKDIPAEGRFPYHGNIQL
jgi:hypothetical protein